jgi:hypothetical protein
MVGQPSDGTRYDLFAIVDVAEDQFMDVEDSIKKDLNPRVEKLEKTSVTLVKDIAYFRNNLRDNLVAKVKSLEEWLKLFEAAPGSLLRITALRTVLVNEIMPALQDLWNFYMMAMKGAGQDLCPGSSKAAGEHLMNRISVLETAVNKSSAGGYGATLSIEQRLRVLESVPPARTPGSGQGSIPSLFGQPLGGIAMAAVVPGGTGGSGFRTNQGPDLVSHINASHGVRTRGVEAHVHDRKDGFGIVAPGAVHCSRH